MNCSSIGLIGFLAARCRCWHRVDLDVYLPASGRSPHSSQNATISCCQVVRSPRNEKKSARSFHGAIGSCGMKKVSTIWLSASILNASTTGSSPYFGFSFQRERSGRFLPSGPRIGGGLDHETLLVVLKKLTAPSMVSCWEWWFSRDFCYCPPNNPILKEVYKAAIHIAVLLREPQVLKCRVRVPQ